MRRLVVLCGKSLVCFNPRICKRCDPEKQQQLHSIQCFNPRICKRCDQTGRRFDHRRRWCFNPRICKRCDTPRMKNWDCICSFNPRICKRCDGLEVQLTKAQAVSIHASVKDATKAVFTADKLSCFNPRICKRCDSLFAIQK